jgi:hypothetical protein
METTFMKLPLEKTTMRIKIVFNITTEQRKAISQSLDSNEEPASYQTCKLFLESQGMMGVEQAEINYEVKGEPK